MLIALARIFHAIQRHQNLPGVIYIRVKLIVKLEVPAAWLNILDFFGPVALLAYFFR